MPLGVEEAEGDVDEWQELVRSEDGEPWPPPIPREVTKLADLTTPLALEREPGRGSLLLWASVAAVLVSCVLLLLTLEDLILKDAERVSLGILEEREAVLREDPGRSSSKGVQGREVIPDASIPRAKNESSIVVIFV